MKRALGFQVLGWMFSISIALSALAQAAETTLNADQVLFVADIADTYSDCAGAYDVFSETLLAVDDQNGAAQAQELANGAEVTHWSLLTLIGPKMAVAIDLAKARRESAGTRYRSSLVSGGLDELSDVLEKCAIDHRRLQNEMVRAIRAYLSSGSDDLKLYYELVGNAFEQGLAQ